MLILIAVLFGLGRSCLHHPQQLFLRRRLPAASLMQKLADLVNIEPAASVLVVVLDELGDNFVVGVLGGR